MNMKLVGVSAIMLLAAIVGGLCHGVNPAAADRRAAPAGSGAAAATAAGDGSASG